MSFKNKKLKLTRPDLEPTSATSVGVSDVFVRTSIDKERMDKVQEILKEETNSLDTGAMTKMDNEVATVLPEAYGVETIDRKLLIPAPSDWNFFTLPDAQTIDILLRSIATDGLLNPIIVWEQEDGKYMILAGHTRETCYDQLFQTTKNPKYLKIPCKVYKKDQLDEVSARRIIIITNIAQRAKESPRMRIQSFGELAKLEKGKAFYGSGIDTGLAVANLTGYSRTTVFFYRKLYNLIEPLLEAFCEGKLSRRAADILASMPKDVQEYLYSNDYLTDIPMQTLRYLKKAKTIAEIDSLLHMQILPSITESKVHRLRVHGDVPQNAKIFALPVLPGDEKAFRDSLEKLITSSEELSRETKAMLAEQLGLRSQM